MKRTFTYLIAITALMIISTSAMAQGGLAPILGSAHDYTITPENTGNTLEWSVVEGTATVEYTVNSAGVSGSTSVANITWNSTGTYTLQFRETNGTSCITLKEVTVVVAANTFDVLTSNPGATCNNLDGTVNPTGDATTSITFKVDMTTSSTWSPNWEIQFTVTPSAGSSIGTVTVSTGSLTESTGTYTLTGLTSSGGDGTVNITMPVTEDAFTVQTTALAITAAKELSFNLADIDSDDWVATQTVNALPTTSGISTDN